MQQIDLNADLGESYGPWRMGDDAALMRIITSANIACGGHAGDPETMLAAVRMALHNGVAIGAHPGYADRLGFGRRVIPMPPAEAARMAVAQVGALVALARMEGARVAYVKPHGALANLAAADPALAEAMAEALQAAFPDLAVLAISGTRLEHAARARGMRVYSEIFADRGYQANGQLVPRGQPGDLIHDPDEAAERLLGFLVSGQMPCVGGGTVALAAQSICVHGDGPSAVAMAAALRDRLTAAGLTLTSFSAA